MSWSIDVLSLPGTSTVLAAAPFRTARATWALDGEGALEVELRPSDVEGGDWREGMRRLLLRNPSGTARYQGWLDRLERAGRPGAVQYRATSRGLRSCLDRRVVHGDVAQVDVRATAIAWALLQHVGSQTFDKTNFTLGTVTGTAPFRKRRYCDGTVVEEAIRELADMDPGGFAWEVDELGKFNAWVGPNARGSDLSGSVTLRPEDVNDWTCVGDASELATYAVGIGGDDPNGCTRPTATVHDPARSAYGRLEATVDEQTDVDSEIAEKAREELRSRVSSRVNLRTTWIEGRGPWAFHDVWLGDVVRAELGPEFGGDAAVRLINVTLTLEPGAQDSEFVECEWDLSDVEIEGSS